MTNKLTFFWVLILSLAFSSCGIFKKAPGGKVYDGNLDEMEGTRVYNEETGRYEEVKVVQEKLDTINWTQVSDAQHPPITDDMNSDINTEIGETSETSVLVDELTNLETEKKATYNVALVLPFLSQNFTQTTDKISEFSEWGLQFYSGLKMGLETLKGTGGSELNLNVTVHDSKGEYSTVSALKSNPDLSNADVIIGAYKKANVKLLADFAKANDKTFISPHSASSNISPENPNYLQVSPTLETHCKEMYRHARRTFSPEQIVLVANQDTKEKNRFRYFNEENQKMLGDEYAPQLKELLIPVDFTQIHEDSIKPYLDPFKTTAFLVPSFSNETFINNFLRMLNIAKDAQPVRVYGLPQWMDFERIEFDYFENLDVHITNVASYDLDNPSLKTFRNNFYSKYGDIPSQEAFLGYDLMVYVGRALEKYGDKFQGYSDLVEAPYLQHRFDFQPNINGKLDDASGVKPSVNQFENKQVYLLNFKDYRFQKAN